MCRSALWLLSSMSCQAGALGHWAGHVPTFGFSWGSRLSETRKRAPSRFFACPEVKQVRSYCRQALQCNDRKYRRASRSIFIHSHPT